LTVRPARQDAVYLRRMTTTALVRPVQAWKSDVKLTSSINGFSIFTTNDNKFKIFTTSLISKDLNVYFIISTIPQLEV